LRNVDGIFSVGTEDMNIEICKKCQYYKVGNENYKKYTDKIHCEIDYYRMYETMTWTRDELEEWKIVFDDIQKSERFEDRKLLNSRCPYKMEHMILGQ